MQYKYKNININYVYYDNSSKVSLIYLHGWGQNIEMMMPIAKPFINKYNVLILDLPGFGGSEEPKEVWSIEDYADMVYELKKELKLKNEILIGHSFGGKISLEYAIKYKPKKVVLLASPYKKSTAKPTFKGKVIKRIKNVPILKGLVPILKKHSGSTDYRNASPMMRDILVKHVNTDLVSDLSKISCPTLAIWGTNDAAVSYSDGQELEKLIPNCGLVTYDGSTHYAYLERLYQTNEVLKSFIEGGE